MEKREIRTYKKGQVIFKQGDAATCMYDIHWGSVGIYVDYGTQQEQLLTKLQSEEFFGEMGLVDAMPRSATAVALENDTRVEVISAATFASFLDERPAKVLMVMQHMSGRIRGLTKDYMDACRAVTEAVVADDDTKEKSAWFRAHQQKFIDDYKRGSVN